MDTIMEVLKVVAASWPIAAIVVVVTAGIVVRRCFKQAADIRDYQYRASNAVTVRRRDE